MSRVLVTGGAGFIGSYLCEHLLIRIDSSRHYRTHHAGSGPHLPFRLPGFPGTLPVQSR